ncbi:MAG: ester cyclase [Thermodesulfobacteriota bacterium]|jgi:predicted ester cyclase
MSAENIAVVRRLIDEVWDQRAFDVLDDLFAADAIISESGVPFPIRGPACAKEGIGAAFPDIRVSIEGIFAANDKVVVRWSSRGTHRGEMQGIPPTNRPICRRQDCRGVDEYGYVGHAKAARSDSPIEQTVFGRLYE